MPDYTLKTSMTLDRIHDALYGPKAALEAHPLTAHLASEFDSVLDQHDEVVTLNRKLRRKIRRLEAKLRISSATLTSLIHEVSGLVIATHKDRRDSAIYKSLFKKWTPSKIARRSVEIRIGLVSGWNLILTQETEEPRLRAIAPKVRSVLEQAKQAFEEKTNADHEYQVFRTLGAYEDLVDAGNAVRKEVYGKVAALPHLHSNKQLGTELADIIFGPLYKPKKVETEPTPEERLAEIDALLASLNEEREEILATMAAQTKKEADAKAKAERVAEAKAAVAQAQAQLAKAEADEDRAA